MTRLLLTLSVVSCLFSTMAMAKKCVENNSANCAGLGYTKSSCPYGGVACPFDASKWHCAEWSCEDGRYTDTQTTNNCVQVSYKGLTCYDCSPADEQCPEGYSDTITSVDNCGEHPEGWNFESVTAGQKVCGKCTAKSCVEGSTTVACSPVGGTPQETGYYSGDKTCLKCVDIPCPDGYSEDITSTSDCATGLFVNGWTVQTASAGDKTCGKCVAKSCPSGSYTITPVCSGTISIVGYSGNSTCKKCNGGGSITLDCCSLSFRYDCKSVGGGCSNSSTYNGKTCKSCGTIVIPPVQQSCCTRGYAYDCTNIDKGCSNTQLGTTKEQCMKCSTIIPANP